MLSGKMSSDVVPISTGSVPGSMTIQASTVARPVGTCIASQRPSSEVWGCSRWGNSSTK